MLHILLTEGNSELKGRKFPIPDGVRKILKSTLNSYNGDKTVDGYKRLNNILSMDGVAYNEMKRIKNFFDHYKGSDKSAEFILNGGDAMKTWVNNTLNTATKAIHDFKQAKKDAGIPNAFIKTHEKDRQTKKKNKPTIAKFDTNKHTKNISDGTAIKYEGIIRESIDIDEYLCDYDVNYVLETFLENRNNGKNKQDWGVLINPSMYQKALNEFTKYGHFINFPTKYIYQWMGIIIKNSCILTANTDLAGHGDKYPMEEIENFLINYLGDNFIGIQDDDVLIKITNEEFEKLCKQKQIYMNESYGVHKDGQYDLFMNQDEVDKYDKEVEQRNEMQKYYKYAEMAEKYNKKSTNYYGFQTDNIGVNVKLGYIYRIQSVFEFLDNIGLYDWMQMPDGSDAWSDFGIKPIYNILKDYDDSKTPEEVIVMINKVLDVYHQRGDMASIFITGGSKTLSQISGTANEGIKRTIVITDKQHKMLKENIKNIY